MGMEKTISPVNISTFRGLNTKLSDVSISDREATSLLNVNLTQETLSCRNGSIIWSTSQLIEGGVAKAVTGIYQGAMGGTTYRVITGGTKIYSASASGVLTDITGAVTLTANANYLFDFVTFVDNAVADVIIASNGIDPPIKWTGAGNVSVLAGVPGNLKYILVRKNRLWGTIDDFLYVSDQLNGEVWDVVFGVSRFKTQGISTIDITGIKEFGDNLAIFKEDGIWLLSGESYDDGYIQKVVTGDGAISGYAIKEVRSTRYGNILIFVNRRGHLKGFNGTQDLIHLSDFIGPNINTYNASRAQYISAVNYKELDQYICNQTESSGLTHDTLLVHDYYLDGFDQAAQIESTILIHEGITANYLALIDLNNIETMMIGTYDGWVLQYDSGDQDVASAYQIAAAPTGAVRVSNVVTITTSVIHGLTAGDLITIESVTDPLFDGDFTVATTPTTTSFTYAQVLGDATSGAGRVVEYADIEAHWQSKKFAFGNAALQKQVNDFDIVFADNGIGEVITTVTTDIAVGISTDTTPAAGAIYGIPLYGSTTYGGISTSYYRVNFEDMAGRTALVGRYFTVRFDNVDSFRFGIEEFILGVTMHGYQAEYTE